VHEARDDAQRGREVRLSQIDHDQDGGVGAIPRALAQNQTQAGVEERARVAVEPRALLEHERRPAADRLQRAEPRHHTLLVGRERRERQGRQAAREPGV